MLPNFGVKLHEHTLQALKDLKVNVILGERPELSTNKIADGETSALSFKDSHKVNYDLVVSNTRVDYAATTSYLACEGTDRGVVYRSYAPVSDPIPSS